MKQLDMFEKEPRRYLKKDSPSTTFDLSQVGLPWAIPRPMPLCVNPSGEYVTEPILPTYEELLGKPSTEEVLFDEPSWYDRVAKYLRR